MRNNTKGPYQEGETEPQSDQPETKEQPILSLQSFGQLTLSQLVSWLFTGVVICYKKSLLMTMRLKEGDKLQEHLEEFNSVVVGLANLGKKVSYEDKSLFLLMFLPPSYQGLKQVLLYRNVTTISYKEVVSSPFCDDAQKKPGQSNKASLSASALNVNHRRS